MVSQDIDSYHPVTKVAARIISYLFHPLFLPVYVVMFLVYEVRLFPDRTDSQKSLVVIQFLVSYTLLPLVTIFLMKALGFVSSVHLKTRKDRILPFVVCEIYYFWAWYVSKNLQYPDELVMFTLAVFVACSLGLIMNSYQKISMHAIAVGTICTFLMIASLSAHINFSPYIAWAFLIAGLTCTSRLIDSDHNIKEIYSGIFVGAISQVGAFLFVV